jgi:hypothetical protein
MHSEGGEPKRRVMLLEVEYWDCGNANHRHKSKEVAVVCMEKQSNRTLPRRWTEEEIDRARARKASGETYAAIGRDYGITGGRMRDVLLHWTASTDDPVFPGLTARTRNCLKAENITTVAQLLAAFETGLLEDVPNLGKLSLQEVKNFLARRFS